MQIERTANPAALLDVPLGRLASWDSDGTRCLGIRVSVPGVEGSFQMMELSPLDDTDGQSPVVRDLGYPDTDGALLFSADYFIDYKHTDVLQVTLGDVEFKPWRIIVGAETAQLLARRGRDRGYFDLATGRMVRPGIGPKYGVDRWRIVRVLPNGEHDVIFERA